MLKLGKLRVLSGREVVGILQQHGFAEVRRRGSHIVMQRQLPDTTITVPVPNHKELKRGLVVALLREAGVTRDQLADLLG